MKKITKALALAAVAAVVLLTAQAPASAAELQAAAITQGTFAGTASVDCAGRGCAVMGSSNTCLVLGGTDATGVCYLSFTLTTGGVECSVGTGTGAASYSAPGAGATIGLTASNTGRSITAVGQAIDTGSRRVIAITINLPVHLCQGDYPFAGTVKYLT